MRTFIFLISICSTQFLFAQYENPVFMNPGDDLQSIVDANPDSTLYIIKEGIHRIQRISPKDGDILIGEPGAILNGSILLEDWEFDGTYWKHHIPIGGNPGWEVQIFPEKAWPIGTTNNATRYIHSLFIDDNPMYREDGFSGLNNLPDTLGWFTYWAGPGMVDTTYGMIVEPFYGDWNYEEDEKYIYTLTDPTGHKMELTYNFPTGARYAIFGFGAKNVTVRGLTVEKYVCTWGAVGFNTDSDSTSFWTIENNDIIRNHRFAVNFTGNAFVRGNKLNHNGWSYLVQWSAKELPSGKRSIIENNEMAYNNYLRSLDGSKFVKCNGLTMRNNHVHNNWTHGLWCDYRNKNILIEGNYIHDNTGVGIHHEISDTAVIRCNRVENNRNRYRVYAGNPDFTQSIYVSTSSNVEIEHNYVRQDSTGRAIIVLQSPRSENGIPFCTDNVNVHDNVTFNNAPPAFLPISGLVVFPETIAECGFPENIFFDNNEYHIPTPISPNYQYFFYRDTISGEVIWNFSGFQNFGFEENGVYDFVPTPYEKPTACEDIPTPFVVQARLFLNCKMNADGTAMEAANLTGMPHFQPFSNEPFNYFEKDVCPKFPDNMVDWVLLQIRDTSNPDEILKQKAALLLTDGRIVDPYPSFQGVAHPGDTLDGVVFYDLIPNLEYTLSVVTRNQSMALANNPILLPNMSHYDFTNPNEVENIADFEVINSGLIALNSIGVTIEASATEICLGESVELTAVPNLIFDNEPNLEYSWNNGLFLSDGLTAFPNDDITYFVELTDEFGCSTFDEVEIIVHQIPDAPTISGAPEVQVDNEEIYQISNPNLTSTYDWTVSGGTIVDNSNNTITVLWSVMPLFAVCVMETSEFGCESEESCVQIDIVNGTNDFQLAGKIVLFPNPTSDVFFIKTTSEIQVQEVKIYDSFGKLVLQQNQPTIEMNTFPKGVYWVKVETNEGDIFKRISLL